MSDVARAKYERLMSEIEALETEIEALESSDGHSGKDVEERRARLGERMRELARVTDGCTRPRASE